jgi:hypothetical protein
MSDPLLDDDDEEFMRRIVWEDRHLFTSVPWSGGFRWFRAPNVICLEQHRSRRRLRVNAPIDKESA